MKNLIIYNATCYDYRGYTILVNEEETQYCITRDGEECGIMPTFAATIDYIDTLCLRKED